MLSLLICKSGPDHMKGIILLLHIIDVYESQLAQLLGTMINGWRRVGFQSSLSQTQQ